MHILYTEHREIERLAAALMRELRSPDDPADIARRIGPLRQQIATELKQHLLAEHDHLLSRLDPDQKARLPGYRAVAEGLTRLRLAYSAHVTDWHHRAVETDFAAYVQATEILLNKLLHQIETEERLLYEPGLRLLATGRA